MKILYHTTPSDNLRHLAELSECMGIDAELEDVGFHPTLVSALEAALAAGSGVVLDVATLKANCPPGDLAPAAALLGHQRMPVLLLAAGSDPLTGEWLRGLTGGGVDRSESVAAADGVGFPPEGRRWSGVLASSRFARKPLPAVGLRHCPAAGVDVIMKLDEMPSFIHVKLDGADLFVWSTQRIFDVSKPLSAEKEFEDAVDEYVPAIIFLRHVFGECCWHNPNPGAGLVIDDPLLQPQYGFINFPRLLESARRCRYHVTLAFIPWNYWRSSAVQARLFREYAECFSVCVHGCDHTKKEFGSADYEDLLNRNFVASRRMARHQARTGVATEPLMVCPQEQYSLEAMRSFADSRQFIGLVCTACMPRNLTAPQICGADLLLPAQDSFFGIPVFKRHYSGDMSVFAMALFLGKPAILVEHHEFFKDGPGRAEAFVSELSTLDSQVKWTSLAETARRTHWRRKLAADRFAVRFFTDVFELESPSTGRSVEYLLTRRIPAMTSIQRVKVKGREVPFVHRDGWLSFQARAMAPEPLRIQVDVAHVLPAQEHFPGLKYRVSVAFRRGLSEFRDNVVARNNSLLSAAKFLAKALKQTSN